MPHTTSLLAVVVSLFMLGFQSQWPEQCFDCIYMITLRKKGRTCDELQRPQEERCLHWNHMDTLQMARKSTCHRIPLTAMLPCGNAMQKSYACVKPCHDESRFPGIHHSPFATEHEEAQRWNIQKEDYTESQTNVRSWKRWRPDLIHAANNVCT